MAGTPLVEPMDAPRLIHPPSRAERQELIDELRRTCEEDRALSRARLELLLTDAAAVALFIERERMLNKRRARIALLESAGDSDGLEVQRLEQRERELEVEAAELRVVGERLRRRFGSPQ